MSVRNLHYLFEPSSIAVVGASNRPRSVGWAVMRNLLQGGFEGPVMPVNPKHIAVAGVLAYPSVDVLPMAPELAVVCTPPASVPGIIESLGAKGTKAAVVITAGLAATVLEDGRTALQAMLDAARPHLLRILGPNCLGLLAPHQGLNASFAHLGAAPGSIALVQQSGALGTALLDWASGNGIGFSHFLSVGDSADVDFGDLLDYLGGEPSAHAILLYVESVRDARKFMSAARAAARNKPVLVVKGGRVPEGARAAASHTGALAAADEVYDAAFRRAGMLRVHTTGQMFDAVSTLAHVRKLRGERLAIVTNGGGPGVLATDELIDCGGALAELSAETVAALDEKLPATWSRGNPVDIIGDAPGQRYADALDVVLEDEGVGGVLVLNAPTAIADSLEAARSLVASAGRNPHGKAVLACWMGGGTTGPARRLLADAGIPSYETPEDGARAFTQLVDYRRNLELLMETPPSVPDLFRPAVDSARLMIEATLADERTVLTEPESKAVLAAYGVPIVETRIARTPDQAVNAANQLGYPVALKILSETITHKSDVGGVVLDLGSAEAVRDAAEGISRRVADLDAPDPAHGFTVQRMTRRPGAFELIVGATVDPVFGPVILFGEGGTGVEVINDKAVALPPLNLKLARELIERTRVARRLVGYRNHPAADLLAVEKVLLQVAQMMVDLPEVIELDINPLLADGDGVVALDARIRVGRADAQGAGRLAIRPYPSDLEETIVIDGERILVRPIRPEDEPAHKAFLEALNPEDIRFRFFGTVRRFAHTQLARFTQVDYDREMAFIATTGGASPETVGVVRAVADAERQRAEFAIVVNSRRKGRGLGRSLLEKMIRYARARGMTALTGEILRDNNRMLKLARSLGFRTVGSEISESVTVELLL